MDNRQFASPFSQGNPYQLSLTLPKGSEDAEAEEFAALTSCEPQTTESWPTSPEELTTASPQVPSMFSPFASSFTGTMMNPQYTADYFLTQLHDYTPQSEAQQTPIMPSIALDVEEPLFSNLNTTTSVESSPGSGRPGPIRRRASSKQQPMPQANNAIKARAKRLSQSSIGSGGGGAPSSPPAPEDSSRRQAHNLVERKYRDSLNGELERLRKTIPHIRDLECSSEAGDGGRPRASKATVLAAATEYIKKLEAEVEGLRVENSTLKEVVIIAEAAPRRRYGGGNG